MRIPRILALLTSSLFLVVPALAGLIGYGPCQAGYSAIVVACYSAASFTFGTVR
jgi:hypothetical protein